MANVAAYYEWLMEKDVLGVLRRHSVPFPVFIGIGLVPVKPGAILQQVHRRHKFSIWLSYTLYARPNWNLPANAKSMDDLKGDGFSTIFTSIFQAHFPNPDKPPLYIDRPAHKAGDQLVVDSTFFWKG